MSFIHTTFLVLFNITMKATLRSILTNFQGYQRISNLWHKIQKTKDYFIDLNMKDVWMEANMCAPFGAVLYPFSKTGKITLFNVRAGLQNALSKNGFLCNFGFDVPRGGDLEGSTIEYQRFEPNDIAHFREYLTEHFIGKGIPRMSEALHRKFRESIAEIFSNAMDHSNTKHGIFACGQFFPEEHRLEFSIADLGIGIRENILQKKGLAKPAKEAIRWAVQKNNTTRNPKDGKPGGLGLKLIHEFVELNEGKVEIVSDEGYWCYNSKKNSFRTFKNPFPGTIVNIEINTADEKTYFLREEIDPNYIF